MNYKYVVLSPYFGKLPNYFNLFLNSCSYNKLFKFIIFTDDNTKYEIPDNVEVINISFNDFKGIIQSKFDFKVSLDNPYKLCDFKPAYGYIFSDYIKGSLYWGHCDLDIIFGDLNKYKDFITCDKTTLFGHFCMYKNTKENNELFMKTPSNTISYKTIFTSKQHFAFDEIGNYGINKIFKLNNKTISNYESLGADINCRYERMYVVKDNIKRIFLFRNGKIISLDKHNNLKEYAYIHLQKRKLNNLVKNVNNYLILYDRLIDYEEINEFNYYICKKKVNIIKWLKLKKKAIENRIKRFLIIRRHK